MMTPETEAKISKVCKAYREKFSMAAQVLKLAQESAELTNAAIDVYYIMTGQYVGDKDLMDLHVALIAECVDVRIMIQQYKENMNCPDTWAEIMAFKLDRALERVEDEPPL